MTLTLAKPVMGKVTSPFGWRKSGFHNGIDFSWLYLHPIKSRRVVAPVSGVVIAAGWDDVAGNYILIQVSATVRVRLIHMKSLAVRRGDRVWRGRFVGVMGATGSSTKPWSIHLHMDLYVLVNGVWRRIDPAPYITLPYPGEHALAGGESTPIDPEEDEEMATMRQIHYRDSDGKVQRALMNAGTGYFLKWNESGATYANGFADTFETGSSQEVTESLFKAFEAAAIAVRQPAALAASSADFGPVLTAIDGVPKATRAEIIRD